MVKIIGALIIFAICIPSAFAANAEKPRLVKFSNGELILGGELFLPEGDGPFPIVLYNHGSAPKMKNSFASAAIGPKFTKNGWGFFMPYRRGQGLSEDQGPYIMDEINSARWTGWGKAAKKLIELNQTDHLSDQMAALSWLQTQDFVQPNRIATAGNSFGGIQVVLGAEKVSYCSAINAAGAAQSWNNSKGLQKIMKQAVANSNSPIFFFQAKNDYDLSPSEVLSSHMKKAGKVAKVNIYPPFGSSAKDGHSFPWAGVSIWFDDALSFINKHCTK